MLVILFAMQSAPTVERVTLPDPAADRFDLAKAKPRDTGQGCDVSATGTDVVVCGRRKAMNFDLSNLPDFSAKPLLAGMDLPGGGRAAVTVQQVDVGGSPSRRVMAGIKLPF